MLEDIINKYNLITHGDLFTEITNVGSVLRKNKNSLLWAKNNSFLKKIEEGIVICHSSDFQKIEPNKECLYLITSKSSRLVFAKIVTEFFGRNKELDFNNTIKKYKERDDLKIGENVFIGENCEIGKNCTISHNSIILSNTIIGNNCVISTGVSIGCEGLGLEFDEETNSYFKFPQIGNVKIGDNVEIGPNSVIRRSALDSTIIKNGTKIGSLVNIGHNCIIGENVILTSQIAIAGSSIIGDKVYIGISASVKNRCVIGNNVTIGQGAVVVKNIPNNETWVGNPAKKM